MSQQNGISADDAAEAETEPKGMVVYLKKLWAYRQYLVIEPFFFFYLMASVFNAVAMQNFPLDKVTLPESEPFQFGFRLKLKLFRFFRRVALIWVIIKLSAIPLWTNRNWA